MSDSVCTGAEGKAGMAAIADPSQSTDLEKLFKDMEKVLPPYARPVFLRFLPEVNKTGIYLLILFSKGSMCCVGEAYMLHKILKILVLNLGLNNVHKP